MTPSTGAKPQKRLRSGFTTGAAAAAAAKAATRLLMGGAAPAEVSISFLDGSRGAIAIAACRRLGPKRALAEVIKDAGDDPDVTHKARIGTVVTLHRPGRGRVIITGGPGVGRVTKPGLEVAVGHPAITSGPKRMIENEVRSELPPQAGDLDITVEVFVPDGKKLARKTLNARLGILDGISILGTTGIVRPMSHAAYKATIEKAMAVARAVGLDQVVLTTGRRSERFAQGLWPQIDETAFVQMGDFFAFSLEQACRRGFGLVVLAVFFGKAVKMAQGLAHTHADKGPVDMKALADWCRQAGGGDELARLVSACNTARQAFDIIRARHPRAIAAVGKRLLASAAGCCPSRTSLEAVIFDFEGKLVYHGQRGTRRMPRPSPNT